MFSWTSLIWNFDKFLHYIEGTVHSWMNLLSFNSVLFFDNFMHLQQQNMNINPHIYPSKSLPILLLLNSAFPSLYICNDPLSPIIKVTMYICIGSSAVIGSSMKDECVFLPPQLWPLRSFSVKDGAYRVPPLLSPGLYWPVPVPALCRLPQWLWVHAWDGHVLARRQQSRALLHTLWLSRSSQLPFFDAP